MKKYFNLFFVLTAVILVFTGCQKIYDKVDTLPYNAQLPYNALVLSSSVTATTPVPADSLKNILVLSWTNPGFAGDSTTTKYIIEFDSSGRNFSKEQTVVLKGSTSNPFTAKSLNTILLNLGFAYNTAYNVDIRITASLANNNQQMKSNVITIKSTPYVVPPKVVPPASKALFITGSATAGGWQAGGGSGVPTPAQQFTKIDSVTYQGNFYLNGGQQYLLLPVNGDWTNKYSVANSAVAGLSAGGDFGYNLSSNFPSPAATGMYTITVDFQHGKFTCVAVGSSYGLMYVPGDYQGWTPATAPALGSPKNDGSYDGYINMPAGGTYQFKLNTTPDWSNSFGDGGGGVLSGSGGNMTVPGAGYYHIVANTTAKTWAAYPTTWGIIGSFAASGWSNDVNMTFNGSAWVGTITTAAGDQFKFRANHSWDGTPQNPNLGESGGKGSLSYGGDNIGDPSKNFSVPAGTHVITLYLNNSGYYTYMIQ